MSLKYELVDSHNPRERGSRFGTLERAKKALAEAIPPGRFYIKDRHTKQPVNLDVPPAE
jgi:hypothetical protein